MFLPNYYIQSYYTFFIIYFLIGSTRQVAVTSTTMCFILLLHRFMVIILLPLKESKLYMGNEQRTTTNTQIQMLLLNYQIQSYSTFFIYYFLIESIRYVGDTSNAQYLLLLLLRCMLIILLLLKISKLYMGNEQLTTDKYKFKSFYQTTIYTHIIHFS